MSKRYRPYAWAILFAFASGILLAVLLGQWGYFKYRQFQLKTQSETKLEAHLKPLVVEQQRFELPGLDRFSNTVDKPLFMESRKPPEEGETEQDTQPAQKVPLNLKLKGIATKNGKAVALFVDNRNKYKRLHVDESIEGWKLIEIQTDRAILEQEGGPKETLILFEPKPKKKTSPAYAGAPVQPGQPVPSGLNPVPPQIPGQPPGFPSAPPPVDNVAPEIQNPPPEPEQPNPDVPPDESQVQPEPPPVNDQ